MTALDGFVEVQPTPKGSKATGASVRVFAGKRSSNLFLSINVRRELGNPERVDILHNAATGQIALRPTTNGKGFKVTAGTGFVGCSCFLRTINAQSGSCTFEIKDGVLFVTLPGAGA